jgi:hypothetical protein
LKTPHLALFFKDFAAWIRSSCVGLNVAGYTTAQVLREEGFDVSVFPVRDNVDIVNDIDKYNETHEERLTHVVISAPWLSKFDLEALVKHFSEIKFVVLSHSNVGFLQADAQGVRLLREYIRMSAHYPNLRIGGNSHRFVNWLKRAYDYSSAVLLPNLYPNGACGGKVGVADSVLKVGIFGAARPYKNFMTAAAAAVILHRHLGREVEVHMSCGGEEDVFNIHESINQMFDGVEGVKIVRHRWDFWDNFIRLVREMDILLQVSYTESFNMVTADGISVGVPSVVSPAIAWAPDSWKADPDDALDVARVATQLLHDRSYAVRAGVRALREHNRASTRFWCDFLTEELR